jgi:signal transduction histidine kinase
MILIDLLIIAISAITGYFFAGRTLLPLKKMVDEQNRFITDASHELRTPLTAAKTSVEVGLRDKKLTLHQARDLLTSNLEEINIMQKLADKLLLLAQVENGNTKKGYAPIALKTCILTAREKVASLAKEKHITISVLGEDVEIAADKESIVELFVILFDNAIKYSEKEMNITVSAEKSDGMGIIKVQDHGVGIDEKDLPHIFDRFYRAEKSRTKTKASGYGLGLSIAKKIVDEHHGTISVESTFGQGTTFTIKLPKKQRHSA